MGEDGGTAHTHTVLYSQGLSISAENCSTLMCRPGRECRQTPGEAPHCACIIKCPDHWKPVCGSDGVSYDSHCSLHRAACVSGNPISQIHAGFCRKEREKSPEREEVESWRTEQTPSPPQTAPAACFETDRNQLRDFLMSWFQLEAKKQVWYSPEMSYKEELISHFFSLDQNRDDFLDSEEMLEGLNSNWTEGSGRILTGDPDSCAWIPWWRRGTRTQTGDSVSESSWLYSLLSSRCHINYVV